MKVMRVMSSLLVWEIVNDLEKFQRLAHQTQEAGEEAAGEEVFQEGVQLIEEVEGGEKFVGDVLQGEGEQGDLKEKQTVVGDARPVKLGF